jgi:hypothetical protein
MLAARDCAARWDDLGTGVFSTMFIYRRTIS